MKKNKGFTLIELLVVIAIIGLLATLAVVSLNNARAKSRDARRISDVKQIQTALELYFNDHNAYPAAAQLVTGAALSGTSNMITYMGQVPANPTPKGTAYTYATSADDAYTIVFELESGTGGLGAGIYTADQNGIN